MINKLIDSLIEQGILLHEIDYDNNNLYLLMNDSSTEIVNDYCTMIGQNVFTITQSKINNNHYYSIPLKVVFEY